MLFSGYQGVFCQQKVVWVHAEQTLCGLALEDHTQWNSHWPQARHVPSQVKTRVKRQWLTFTEPHWSLLVAGPSHKRARAPPCSSVSSHRDADMYTKDTVLSTLVLCGIHAGEGSCHSTEELEGKRTRISRSDREIYWEVWQTDKMRSGWHAAHMPGR